jgi:hypothetical protein
MLGVVNQSFLLLDPNEHETLRGVASMVLFAEKNLHV